MTEQRRTDLKQLQRLDVRIQKAQKRIGSFDPLFEEVEEPALILESELGTTRTRLQEMKLEERRLELASEEKRTRQKRLDERLGSVRNLREEAAVSAELEMVKRSIQNDEQEALTLMDQLRKMEERSAELEAAYAEASELVEPKRDELIAERAEAEKELAALRDERQAFAAGLDARELQVYDAIRAGGRAIAVAELTEDGACSHCYGMIPLQLQNEIRHGLDLIRCEGCGVILSAAEPVPEGEEPEPEVADEPSGEASAAGDASDEGAEKTDEDRVAELFENWDDDAEPVASEAGPEADEERDGE